MNDKIRNHLVKYNKAQGWDTDDACLIETLTEAKRVYRKEVEEYRWWNLYLYVVDIDGMLIGFDYAETTGDASINDVGWEFECDSVHEMVAVEKTVTTYEPVEEAEDETQ